MISGDRRFQTFTTLSLKYVALIEQLSKCFKSYCRFIVVVTTCPHLFENETIFKRKYSNKKTE